MFSKASAYLRLTIILCIFVSAVSYASEDNGFFVKPHFSWSNLSSDRISVDGMSGQASYNNGFSAGLGVGYDYGNGFRSELDFEYRTNEYDSLMLSDGRSLTGGDFSSAIVYLNGYYYFSQPERPWSPFIGVGLGWVQEIDFDAGSGSGATSYSQSGDWAYQLIAGMEYELSSVWRLQAQFNRINISGLSLKEEGGQRRITGADYSVWGLGVGLVYRF